MTEKPKTSAELFAEADALRKRADEVAKLASEARSGELRALPLLDRLVFAAYARCDCGLGLAYDPAGEVGYGGDGPFPRPNAWECSGVLLGTGDRKKLHSRPFSFAFYKIKSEGQPSANGATTRPKPDGDETAIAEMRA